MVFSCACLIIFFVSIRFGKFWVLLKQRKALLNFKVLTSRLQSREKYVKYHFKSIISFIFQNVCVCTDRSQFCDVGYYT